MACSALSAASSEPLAGSAQVAAAHVLLEHGGPWPSEGLDALEPDYVASLAGLAARVGLIRRPRAHNEDAAPGVPASPWILVSAAGRLVERQADAYPSAAELAAVIWTLARGLVPAGWGEEPYAIAVCTHARRDACCARLGRRLFDALADKEAARAPGHLAEADRVWETTHLGGHRFAATCLTLPSGVVYGRVPEDRAAEVYAAVVRRQVVPDLMRGRSGYAPALQAAEIAARERSGVVDESLILVSSDHEGDLTRSTWSWPGGSVNLTVQERPGPLRRTSCAKDKLESKPEYVVIAVTNP